MESLLVKALNSQDNSIELQKKIYADDVNVRMLNAQLGISAEGR